MILMIGITMLIHYRQIFINPNIKSYLPVHTFTTAVGILPL